MHVPNALKLLNEWRDTACAVTTAVASVMGVPLDLLLQMWVGREVARLTFWHLDPPKQIVGGPRPPNQMKVICSTVAATSGLTVIGSLIPNATTPPDVSMIVMEGLLSLGFIYATGGIKPFLKTYNQIWDWPRKSGEDGPSETDKLKNTLSEIGQLILPARHGNALSRTSSHPQPL